MRSRTWEKTRGTALLAAFGLVLGAGVVTAAPAPEPAAAAIGECPEGTIPGPGNTNPIWTDQNVAIYAGADFQVRQAAAEAEGVVVVAGDMSVDKTPGGRFNVGWVGVGSAVVPLPGTTMLAVGGDLSVGAQTVLDVGANAISDGQLLGGDVSVGGQSFPDYEVTGLRYELNNGMLTQGMGAAAIAPWSTWGSLISDESAGFAAEATTGTTTVGALLTFTGDGTSDPQVFTVDASVLAANPGIGFAGIPDGAAVIVNVTGGPVTWAPNYFAEDGVRADDPASPLFGVVAARTLWNFVDATSVHIAGSSQVLGSILVPGANADPSAPTLRVTASTNGRLYTNGTILMDGVGNEHHNYPWLVAPFDCVPEITPAEIGSITVEKILSPEDAALIPPGTTFHGLVTCPAPAGGELIVEWEAAPGETTTVEGLPVGAECVITETVGVVFRERQSVGGGFDATRLSAWDAPSWTLNGDPVPAPVEFVVPSPADEVQLAFAVTNTLATGSFTIEKIVANPDDVAYTGGFTGGWTCSADQDGAAELTSGTWELMAGEVTDPVEVVVGAWCRVTEVQPADPAAGEWSAPVVTPGATQITAGSAEEPLSFTVTNTLTATVGAFVIEKAVVNDDDLTYDDSFTGAWRCTTGQNGGDELAAGTWSLSAGTTSDAFEAPVGAWCSVTEATPAEPAAGFWSAPVITPGATQITAGSFDEPLVFTVVNTLLPDTDTGGEGGGDGDGDGELSATGGGVPTWLVWAGAGLLVAGAAVLVVQVVRRRRS
ncbi:choice-of-anchor A family protein [Microbacterium sp. HJ5]